jgi:DNA-binding GntR family transcriptional regulator
VAADVREQIASGKLRPGTRLLAERALAEHYDVSYGSIRKAMDLLLGLNLLIWRPEQDSNLRPTA